MNSMNYKVRNAALVCAISILAAAPVQAYESPIHVFSVKDIQGGFNGTTFGPAGAAQDTGVICGIPGASLTVPCPPTAPEPVIDKEGVTLYPIDSEFGFYVVDFLGARGKERDGDYMEGFAGDIMDGDTHVGLKVSNAATDRYKVKKPYGTWCQGLGGSSIKCSTEHYSVLEHVLSCHEVLPYRFADPDDGTQAILEFPLDPDYTGEDDSFNCVMAELDDELFVVENGQLTTESFIDASVGVQMNANDNTTVLNDISVSTDYTVTLKDDGKVLYRWGDLIKRPNDIRMYARLPLPDEWKEPGADFDIISAQLVVNHWITNNPNDQLRPEDLENEAATGRKPSYRIDGDQWKSTIDCYEGDGDYMDTDEGSTDPHELGSGSVLRNERFADPNLVSGSTIPLVPRAPPLRFSSDLIGGFTNGYYTSTNRDPFEWSYRDMTTDPLVYEFVGTALPLSDAEAAEASFELVSGPRWRLRANKFGQNIPGLEIPLGECSPPPFTKENIKYEVGEMVTTVINLLDWADENSPLKTSKGWVDVLVNSVVEIAGTDSVSGIPYTTNGLPMTEDFDLAVYIKGDRKPLALFNARLLIEYDGETPVEPEDYDVAIIGMYSEAVVVEGVGFEVLVVVANLGPAAASGELEFECTSNRGDLWEFVNRPFTNVEDGWTEFYTFPLAEGVEKPAKVTCVATAVVDGDIDPTNNTDSVVTKIVKP